MHLIPNPGEYVNCTERRECKDLLQDDTSVCVCVHLWFLLLEGRRSDNDMTHDQPAFTNRLIHEHSLYLQQHAHNPVDWYPWGEEALQTARQQDKPILLSIGYSACHWCHVMEHESFEDPATAEIMNRHFINIKVDREERPDLDELYMAAIVAMTGQGGWPLNVFLFPDDGTPFYGGTYFPPEDKAARYNMPGFKQILQAIAEAYTTRRDELRTAGQQIVEHLQQRTASLSRTAYNVFTLSEEILDSAFAVLQRDYDYEHGGFGKAPKFPQPMILEFLVRYVNRTGNDDARRMVTQTLHAMAEGGMYDHVGGGFHRYSVDQNWMTPHFEKMLYDNALLARIYTIMYQITKETFHGQVAEETLDYMAVEMTHPEGGFYSTQDADSDGKEGAFFVWTPDEFRAALGRHTEVCTKIFGVTEEGNFEGSNILHRTRPLEEISEETDISVYDLETIIYEAKYRLYTKRKKRTRPGRDEKVITAWNGMAMRTFADAFSAFNRPDFLQIAQRNAKFMLENLRRDDGRVLRCWTDPATLQDADNATSRDLPGYLEDYAQFADGLLALYTADGNPRWLRESIAIADAMLNLFWDDDIEGFYNTAHDHETLVVRPRSVDDNATPSGNSVAVDVLLRLAVITGNETYRQRADTVLNNLLPAMRQMPMAFGRLLCAADFAVAPIREVVLAGEVMDIDIGLFRLITLQPYRPYTVVAYVWTDDYFGQPADDPLRELPLLRGRGPINNLATAYVCEGYACKQPVTDVDDLKKQLNS